MAILGAMIIIASCRFCSLCLLNIVNGMLMPNSGTLCVV